MICSNCGSAIDDRAAVCVHCGAATPLGMSMSQGPKKPLGDPNEPASGGMVFISALIPLLGLIMGATESSNGKKRASKSYFIAAVCGMAFWAIVCILFTVAMCLLPFLVILLES